MSIKLKLPHRMTREVVWQQLHQRHVRLAICILFLPKGYALRKTKVGAVDEGTCYEAIRRQRGLPPRECDCEDCR